ncbi:MAG: lysozyme inhibitor LprI family protein [Lachnospiraceae bacterium]
MKKYRKIIWMLCAAASMVAVGACGSAQNEGTTTNQENTAVPLEKEESDDASDTESEPKDKSDTKQESEETSSSDASEEKEKTSSKETDQVPALFQKLSGYTFTFCSGAGAWSTELNINADRSFSGFYSDSDMGDTGEGYPNGTVYQCGFEGAFTKPEKVNEYTYLVRIESINYEKNVDEEEFIDGIRYHYSEPYGLDNANEIYIYLPGAPVSELPEEFKQWVSMTGMLEGAGGTTTTYGIYNVEAQDGFFGAEKTATDASGLSDSGAAIDTELANVESRAAEVQAKLDQATTQTDINEASSELYTIWDTELNQIWGTLKATLDEATMNTIVEEEKNWISQKEQAMKEAGAAYEGGSMQSAVESQKGAELTRERVYQLAAYLR